MSHKINLMVLPEKKLYFVKVQIGKGPCMIFCKVLVVKQWKIYIFSASMVDDAEVQKQNESVQQIPDTNGKFIQKIALQVLFSKETCL